MKGFLDRAVGRAGQAGHSLRPRVAHRFGPPEHHIAASDDPAGPGRGAGDDDDGPPEGAAAMRSASLLGAAEVSWRPGDEGGEATRSGPSSSAQNAGARPGGVGSAGGAPGAGAPSSFVAAPRASSFPVRTPRGAPAAATGSPARDSFVERLRASLREARATRAARATRGRRRRGGADPRAGALSTRPRFGTHSAATAPAPGEARSRSAAERSCVLALSVRTTSGGAGDPKAPDRRGDGGAYRRSRRPRPAPLRCQSPAPR